MSTASGTTAGALSIPGAGGFRAGRIGQLSQAPPHATPELTCALALDSAGVGRTGVFITLSIVLERMRYEGVVDIFQTVKMLRTQRPAMVQMEVRGGEGSPASRQCHRQPLCSLCSGHSHLPLPGLSRVKGLSPSCFGLTQE